MTEQQSRKTEYVVLEADALNPGIYGVLGTTQAHGPVQAVKLLTSDRDLPEESITEQFVGVPVSNWTPVGKSVERTEPVVKYAALDQSVADTIPRMPLAAVEDEPEPADENEREREQEAVHA